MITFAPTFSKFLLPRSRFVTQFGIPDGSHPEWKRRPVRAVRRAMALAAGKKNVDYHLGTLLRDSDGLIALGESHATTLLRHLPTAKKKLLLIPPPPLLRMMAPDNGSKPKARPRNARSARRGVCACIFRRPLSELKGVETLSRAFQIVAAQRNNLRLVLIGGQANLLDGYEYFNEICELARQLKIDDKVLAREYDWDSFDGSLLPSCC